MVVKYFEIKTTSIIVLLLNMFVQFSILQLIYYPLQTIRSLFATVKTLSSGYCVNFICLLLHNTVYKKGSKNKVFKVNRAMVGINIQGKYILCPELQKEQKTAKSN